MYRNWRIFNLPEELDVAGEWWVDKENKVLYYLPAEGEEEIEISNMNTSLVKVGMDNVTISGIKFANTNWHAIEAANVSGLTVKNCDFAAIGRHAIEASGTKGARIKKNTLKNIGFRGISVSDGSIVDDKISDLTENNNVISYNDIDNTGAVVRSYAHAIVVNGVGGEVRANTVKNIRSIAIGYGGALNKIVYNKLTNVVTEALDAGAIYSGRNWYYLGNEIAYNDITIPKKESDEVISGIYLDDYLSGTKVHHNIVRNATRGVFSSGGVENKIYSNVFENCASGVRVAKWDTTTNSFSTLVAPTEEAYTEKFADILTYLNKADTENVSSAGLEVYNNYALGADDVVWLSQDNGGVTPVKNENNEAITDITEGLAKADVDINRIGEESEELDTTIAWADVDGAKVTVNFVSTYAGCSVVAAAKDADGALIAAKIVSDGDSFTLEEAPSEVDFYVFDSLQTIKPMTKK